MYKTQEDNEDYSLLNYCWQHRLFDVALCTTNGSDIEVVDQGLFDRHHGHRFFNAKVRMDGMLWVGNVLTLNLSSDYFEAFDNYKAESPNTILVLCNAETQQCIDSNGCVVPTVVAEIPDKVFRNYSVLAGENGMTLCHRHVKDYTSRLSYHAWLAALQTEHLEEESENCRNLSKQNNGNWQMAFTGQLFKAFGFGVNEDIMSNVFATIPPQFLFSHHIDNLFQVESVVFGQAGLLEIEGIPEKYQHEALMDGYIVKMRNEWLYLAKKYQMPKPKHYRWKPFSRGQYMTQHVSLSMLANLLYMRKTDIGLLSDAKNLNDFYRLAAARVSPYWQMHSQFGAETDKHGKPLTRDRQSRILMTCHIPLLFACGREENREDLCDLAFDLTEQMKLYRTVETAYFERLGIKADTACDTAALCRLKNFYCDRRDCLRCRFGLEFIKHHPKMHVQRE